MTKKQIVMPTAPVSRLGVSVKSAIGAFETGMKMGGVGISYNPKNVDSSIDVTKLYVVRASKALNKVWWGNDIPEKALLGATILLAKLKKDGDDSILEQALYDFKRENDESKTLAQIWSEIVVEKNNVGDDAFRYFEVFYNVRAKIKGFPTVPV